MVAGGYYMEFFIKSISVLMVIMLIAVQLMLVSPYGAVFRTDSLNGEPIKNYQSIIEQGYVTLNLLGEYVANSASLFINGEHAMVIHRFPVKLELTDGDVVEIHASDQTHAFHVYLSDKSSGLYTDMRENSVKISPGMNRLMRVNIRN